MMNRSAGKSASTSSGTSSPTTRPPKTNRATKASAPMFTGSNVASRNTTTRTRIDASSRGIYDLLPAPRRCATPTAAQRDIRHGPASITPGPDPVKSWDPDKPSGRPGRSMGRADDSATAEELRYGRSTPRLDAAGWRTGGSRHGSSLLADPRPDQRARTGAAGHLAAHHRPPRPGVPGARPAAVGEGQAGLRHRPPGADVPGYRHRRVGGGAGEHAQPRRPGAVLRDRALRHP